MNWTAIKSITVSDIHFGNPANPARDVAAGLDKKLTVEVLMGVNILYLPGDIFDRGLPVNHPDVPIILSWGRRLLARCAQCNVIVVIVEGTPSHDRLQSQIFVAINDAAEEEYRAELYYVKEVDIIFIEKLGIHVLCIPDAKNTSDEVTYQQVRSLMATRAIEKVDFALVHGFFEFQVDFGGSHTRFHDSEKYLAIVRYLIWVGHDHEHQEKGRILIQGSPDRQRHGMESPKGFLICEVQRDGTFTAHFEENEHAKIFKTITLDDDVDTAHTAVHHVCRGVRAGSHIRIAAKRGHPALSSLAAFQADFPLLVFTKKVIDDDKTAKSATKIIENDEKDYVPFTIDPSNIQTVIESRLSIALIDADEKAYFNELMESIK